MSALIGTSLLFSHTLSRLYRSVYVNVFSTRSNQDLLDAVSPYVYTVFVGVSLLSEAPTLDGSGFGMYMVKVLNVWAPKIVAEITLNFKHRGLTIEKFEPRSKKTGLRGFRPALT